jgi:hypothetical protein
MLAAEPETISSSQRRPRAIALTRRARRTRPLPTTAAGPAAITTARAKQAIDPLGWLSRGHTIALVRAMILTMIEPYTDGLQSPAVALMHSPLKRLAVPVVVILTLAGMAGCFAYFRIAPAPVSQSAALAAPPATEARSSTVGQARATGTLTVVDRLRPSNEDIVKAFRQATEDRQPVEAQDAALDTDEPAIAGPVPLPKRRPPPRP